MKKILIFGGSFDPVHKAHIELVQYAAKLLKVDEVHFIISGQSNLKHKPIASYEQRRAMLEIAISNLDHEIYKIKDYENTTEVTYSYDTIKKYYHDFDKDHLFFLLGTDQYLQLDKWSKFELLNESVTFVCLKRSEVSIKKINDSDIILENQIIDAASTYFRKKYSLTNLDFKVLHYIAKNKLYLFEKVAKYMNIHRYEHTIRVMEAIEWISSNCNEQLRQKALLSAVFHDLGKQMSKESIYEILSIHQDVSYYHVYHGFASAVIARDDFGINDEELLEAICLHVVPDPDDHKYKVISSHIFNDFIKNKSISKLTKMLYCADKLESQRTEEDMPNCHQLLKQSKDHLDEVFDKVYNYTKGKYPQ